MESTLTRVRGLSREAAIGLGVSGLAVTAMTTDHLIHGDVTAFVWTSSVALALAALLFGLVIPRTQASPDGTRLAATRGLACAVLSVLSIPGLFVGLPFVVGGAAVALGLIGREGERSRMATVVLVIGAAVVLFAVVAYASVGGNTE